MKISTKGKYALEIAVDLALHSDRSRPESLKNIAGRRGLSEKYLERIVKLLRDAGVVCVVRGARGGYYLSRPPGEISALEILAAAEGPLAPVDCLISEPKCGMECGACPTRGVWEEMWKIIKETAGNLTVEDLARAELLRSVRGI